MINWRIILKLIGLLIIGESLFMLLSIFVSFIYKEGIYNDLLIAFGITAITGFTLWYFNQNANKKFGKREGYIIVSLTWFIFSVFGALPFVLTESISSFTDAYFETISGFTTTGASILNNIEEIPNSLLFWRSITQWIGGMGIIVLSLAVLPILGIGGMQLFVAEVPGLTPDKIHPRVKETAKRLWGIYILYTFLETILLVCGEMNLFDAINHSFTTMATGGYSTKQASIANFSPYTQYVITAFMFVAGVNFTLSYFALKLNFRKIIKNEEFKYYVGFILIITIIITIGLLFTNNQSLESSFRDSIFQVVSIITTTGFATKDYLLWHPVLGVMIFGCLFLGGSAGSTGGGIKIVRIMLFFKNSLLELKRLIHPTAVIPVRINNKSISESIVATVNAFIAIYIFIMVFSTIVLSALGLDLESSIGAAAATLGNVGPGIGSVGPGSNFAHIPAFGKWFLSFLMVIGRLELFTVLILFTPAFWKN